MTELIIIKTDNGQEIKNFLEQKRIAYEIYRENSSQKKITSEELGKAYKEAYSDPRRYQEAKLWEQASINDWSERTNKNKK